MFCRKCGAELDDYSVFCNKCGTPVSEYSQEHSSSNSFYAPPQKRHGCLKSVLIVFAVLIVISVARNAGARKAHEESLQSGPLSDDTIDVTISDCEITYIGHEVIENLGGDLCLAVYYEFTNNSDEYKSFITTANDVAFQNGIELETSMFHLNQESKNREVEIKPGVKITVCSGFVLRDDEDIELEIGEWINFDDEIIDKMVLSVK